MLAEVAGPHQRAAMQENEAWALYRKIHPGCPGLTFLGTDAQLYQS